jgi:hypothetical protein
VTKDQQGADFPVPMCGTHSDVFSFSIPMCGGKVYGMSFINGYLRYASMTLLRVNSDTTMTLDLHLAAMPVNFWVRVHHSNQGGEYMGNEIEIEIYNDEDDVIFLPSSLFNMSSARLRRGRLTCWSSSTAT